MKMMIQNFLILLFFLFAVFAPEQATSKSWAKYNQDHADQKAIVLDSNILDSENAKEKEQGIVDFVPANTALVSYSILVEKVISHNPPKSFYENRYLNCSSGLSPPYFV